MSRLLTLVLVILFLFSSSIFATVIKVPADQPTIQAGIDTSTDGDSVIVADGIYTGNGNRDINFNGKKIVVISLNGAESTVIDCQGSISDQHRGFIFNNDEDSSSVVDGFTIKNGFTDKGGGIYCDFSSPTIRSNIIVDNSAGDMGAGIYCYFSRAKIINNIIRGNIKNESTSYSNGGGGIYCNFQNPVISGNMITGNSHRSGGGIFINTSSPTIINNSINDNNSEFNGGGIECIGNSSPFINGNEITGNRANTTGGGIYCWGSKPTISFNNISNNTNTGITLLSGASALVEGNLIARNHGRYGGGIYCSTVDVIIKNNTISGNSCEERGGGVSLKFTSPVMENNIISFNVDTTGAISCNNDSQPVLICCNIYGNPAGDWVGYIANQAGINGNLNNDPEYCDTTSYDFHLKSVSPCAPANNSCGELIGALQPLCSKCSDLIIDSFNFSGSIVKPGQKVGDKLSLTVTNIGEESSGAFNVGFYLSEDSIITTDDRLLIGGREYVSNIEPGETISVGIFNGMKIPDDWLYDEANLGVDEAFLGVIIDEFNSVNECYENNNQANISVNKNICGDTNFDGKITFADVTILINYYFHYWYNWPYIELTGDMDCSGSVQINDIMILVGYLYGHVNELCCR